MPDTVVISPHLDDAVLSLGGLIGREVAAGRSVEVWSCFTEGPPLAEIPEHQRVFGDYSIRRAEDERALAVLGAGRRWLDSAGADLAQAAAREDAACLSHAGARGRVRSAVRDPDRARAGVRDGGADLRAARGRPSHRSRRGRARGAAARCSARGASARVQFYEDPYALGGACRRAHFVTRRHGWRLFGAPAWASPRVAALLRVVALSARGPGIEDYLPEAARLPWRCTPAALAGGDERRKLDAVLEYRSQVEAFGGAARVRAFMQRGHRSLGGEPIWSCHG